MQRMTSISLPAQILALVTLIAFSAPAAAHSDPLPSWNQGPAKQAIVAFVKETTEQASPNFVPPAERIATFNQDGTLWVEHPMYTQVVYCLERVPTVVRAKPELAKVEPFKTREYAYGPAQGLPDTHVGAFTQALHDEAKQQGWVVISMKNDWKRVFAFER